MNFLRNCNGFPGNYAFSILQSWKAGCFKMKMVHKNYSLHSYNGYKQNSVILPKIGLITTGMSASIIQIMNHNIIFYSMNVLFKYTLRDRKIKLLLCSKYVPYTIT